MDQAQLEHKSGADTQTYLSLPNKVGGPPTVPLALLQHFRGNLNGWDPALIDALASTRRVVTFVNAGVGLLHRHHSGYHRADGQRCHRLGPARLTGVVRPGRNGNTRCAG